MDKPQNVSGRKTTPAATTRSLQSARLPERRSPEFARWIEAKVNPKFTATFTRLVFEVVNAPQGTIPASLKKYFGPTGFTCSAKGKTDLQNYGFLALPAGATAGHCGAAG